MKITDSELELMKVLWERSPIGSSDIIASLMERGWSESTVRTLLARLVKKGAVSAEGEGNRYLYRPAVPKEEYSLQEVRDFARKFLDKAAFPLFAQFLSQTDLKQDEIRELKRILEEKENDGR